MHIAAETGQADLCRRLVKAGAPLNFTDEVGFLKSRHFGKIAELDKHVRSIRGQVANMAGTSLIGPQ